MQKELICDDVIKRIGEIYGVSTDIELSKKIGVASQTISTWRNRNKIPYEKVVEIAGEMGVSLDFLIFGHATNRHGESVNPELMRYLFHKMDDELFLHERIANEQLGFDLLCRAYNATVKDLQGKAPNLLDQKVKSIADNAAQDVITFYLEMFRFVSSTIDDGKGTKKSNNQAASPVSQNFNAEVGQVGGGDIHNYSKKDK